MNPARKACLDAARQLWQDQPSLGLLETANEVRVVVRARRDPAIREVPGVEAIRKWRADAIEAGELAGPQEPPRRARGRHTRGG